MYEYEKFLVKALTLVEPQIKIPADFDNDVEKCRIKAVRYLEMCCSKIYGSPAEIHVSKVNNNSMESVPAIFDNAIILDSILDVDKLDSELISNIASVIQENRRKSGFFNYFLNVDDTFASAFPDDIVNTSVCMLSLYKAKYLSMEDCRATAEKMLIHLKVNEKGQTCPWLQTDEEKNIPDLYKDLYSVEIGGAANFLTFLATFGLDTDPRVVPTLKFLEESVDNLFENCGKIPEFSGFVYFKNKFVVYWLLSRYVCCGKTGMQKFGIKLAGIVNKELLEFEFQDDTKALDVACLILSAVNLELHSKVDVPLLHLLDDLELIQAKLVKLVGFLESLQNEDGSFDTWMLYNLYKMGEYACSKATVTAIVISAIAKVKKEIIQKI